jgi:Bacteriophage clamp loader A subunit
MIVNELNFSDVLPPQKEKKANDLEIIFSFLNSINTKQNIMYGEREEKQYRDLRFQILRVLSFYSDAVSYVNLINQRSLSPRMEYEFLLNVIPQRPRREKWLKRNSQSVFLRAVQEYYGFNEDKAEEAMKLLSVKQLTMIEEKIMKKDHVCDEMISLPDSVLK